MTDEEMADKSAFEYFGKATELVDIQKIGLYKDGFFTGLKAGRSQWHDLRKDPNDLPEEYIPVLNQNGEHRSYDGHFWRDCDDVIYTDIIAWCEIPTFDKE